MCVWHVDSGGCVDVNESSVLWASSPRRPSIVSNGSIWCRRFSTEPTAKKTKINISRFQCVSRSSAILVNVSPKNVVSRSRPDQSDFRSNLHPGVKVLFACRFHDRQWSKDSKAQTHSCRPSFICPSHGVNALRWSPLCCALVENAHHRTSVSLEISFSVLPLSRS